MIRVRKTITTCRRRAVAMPWASAIAPVIGTPSAPVTKPRPRIRPEASPARPAISCCAITSISGPVEAAVKPSSAPIRKAGGPMNCTKRRVIGIVSTSEPIVTARRQGEQDREGGGEADQREAERRPAQRQADVARAVAVGDPAEEGLRQRGHPTVGQRDQPYRLKIEIE